MYTITFKKSKKKSSTSSKTEHRRLFRTSTNVETADVQEKSNVSGRSPFQAVLRSRQVTVCDSSPFPAGLRYR